MALGKIISNAELDDVHCPVAPRGISSQPMKETVEPLTGLVKLRPTLDVRDLDRATINQSPEQHAGLVDVESRDFTDRPGRARLPELAQGNEYAPFVGRQRLDAEFEPISMI